MASLGHNESKQWIICLGAICQDYLLLSWIYFQKTKNPITFFIISQHWNSTDRCSGNPSTWKKSLSLHSQYTMVVADVLETQLRSQGISNHGTCIDLVTLEYSSFSPRNINPSHGCLKQYTDCVCTCSALCMGMLMPWLHTLPWLSSWVPWYLLEVKLNSLCTWYGPNRCLIEHCLCIRHAKCAKTTVRPLILVVP